MAWRLAKSLGVLRDEILREYPGTTFWTLGDEDHQDEPSDHNPNPARVVCAADVLADGGLDLAAFAEQVRTSGHPALKYVIYDRRIAMAGKPWRPYYGKNPHSSHAHVSVGDGPDGYSTGPYDDTSSWGVADSIGDDDVIGLKEGDRGERVVALQALLNRAGYPVKDDGVYGKATSAALLKLRRADTPTTSGDGREVTGWALAHLMCAVAKAQGGGQKGEKGDRGPEGPPGAPATFPMPVTIVGEVRA